LGTLRDLRKRGDIWRYDQGAGRWTKVSAAHPARPGEVLVMAAKDGGYDPVSGLDPAVRQPVPDSPSLDDEPDTYAGTEDAFRQDDTSVAQPRWLPLQEHSDDVRDQAKALLDVTRPELPAGVADAVVMAGYAHDAGKMHETWQDALCRLAPEAEREEINRGRPWAKSGGNGRLWFAGGVTFRHELGSMMLLDGPLRGLLDGLDDPDLVRYLVLAHHGKLRVQVRGPDETDEKTLLGLRDGDIIEVRGGLLGQPDGDLTVELDQFTLGGPRSWTRTALALRDCYGPFVLAYLETLVRMADWRASAGMEEAR
jgi:CRISPR-associated endonuclease/helicase Cas3